MSSCYRRSCTGTPRSVGGIAVQPAFDALTGIVDEIFPLDTEDVERAKQIVLTTNLSARDSLHLAVMRYHGVDRILSFDRDFDHIAGVSRLH